MGKESIKGIVRLRHSTTGLEAGTAEPITLWLSVSIFTFRALGDGAQAG